MEIRRNFHICFTNTQSFVFAHSSASYKTLRYHSTKNKQQDDSTVNEKSSGSICCLTEMF